MTSPIIEAPLPPITRNHRRSGSTGLIVLVALLTVWVGILHRLMATPLFRAASLIQLPVQARHDLFMEEWVHYFFGIRTTTVEIENIRSSKVIGQVVDNTRLLFTVRPHYFPLIGKAIAHRHEAKTGIATPLFGLKRYAWGGERIQIDALDLPSHYVDKELTLIAGEAGTYRLVTSAPKFFAQLGGGFNTEPQTLVSGRVGEKVQHGLDGIPLNICVVTLKARPGTEFIVMQSSRRNAIEALQKRIEVTEQISGSGVVEVAFQDHDPVLTVNTVNAIVNEYLRQDLEAQVARIKKLEEILEQQITGLKTRLDISTTVLDQFCLEHGIIDPLHESLRIHEQINTVTNQIKQIDQTRERAVLSFGPTHEIVTALDAQHAQLIQQQETLNQQLRALPNTWRQLTHLSREVEINTQLYLSQINRASTLQTWNNALLAKNDKKHDPILPMPRILHLAISPNTSISPIIILWALVALVVILSGYNWLSRMGTIARDNALRGS